MSSDRLIVDLGDEAPEPEVLVVALDGGNVADSSEQAEETALQPASRGDLLYLEQPVIRAPDLEAELRALSELVDREGRATTGRITDEEGNELTPVLADDRAFALSPNASEIAVCRAWSQCVFGLPAAADHLLGRYPALQELVDGPFAAQRPDVAQVYVQRNGARPTDPVAPLTVGPFGAVAVAWSNEGDRLAFVEAQPSTPDGSSGPLVRELDVASGAVTFVGALPPDVPIDRTASLTYGIDGRHLLYGAVGCALVIDPATKRFAPLPVAAASWAQARGAGWLIGVTSTDAGVELGWFDLATWQSDPICRLELPGTQMHDLDLSGDGSWLAAVVPVAGSAVDSAHATNRVVVVDVGTGEVEPVSESIIDGSGDVRRRQWGPRWSAPIGGARGAAEVDELRGAMPLLAPIEHGPESGDLLEELSEGFFLAATDPKRPGTCTAEAVAYARRAAEVAGPAPWLESRLAGLPEPRDSDAIEPDGVESVLHAIRAALAMAADRQDDAQSEWESVLQVHPDDQVALLQLHYLRTDERDAVVGSAALGAELSELERACMGPDERLALEACIRHGYLSLSLGMGISGSLTRAAGSTDRWFASRAKAILAMAHLRNGEREEARRQLEDVARGPHMSAAMTAAELAAQAGWADEPPFVEVVQAIQPGDDAR